MGCFWLIRLYREGNVALEEDSMENTTISDSNQMNNEKRNKQRTLTLCNWAKSIAERRIHEYLRDAGRAPSDDNYSACMHSNIRRVELLGAPADRYLVAYSTAPTRHNRMTQLPG